MTNKEFDKKVASMGLRLVVKHYEEIDSIQQLISKGKIKKISFMIYENEGDSENNMPVVDYLVEGIDKDISDCSFDSLEDAIHDIAKRLQEIPND